MVGFTVQGPAQPIVRVDLASDEQGKYRASFSADETVTIWINPPNRPLIPFMMVRKYICPLTRQVRQVPAVRRSALGHGVKVHCDQEGQQLESQRRGISRNIGNGTTTPLRGQMHR